MQPNPLLPSQPKDAEPAIDASAQKVVRLVSNTTADQIKGLSSFLKLFNSAEARAEVEPFRYVIQRKVRRSMGGKFSSGLSTEVTESVEINPNQDLFGLRRWLGGIRQDPASVMLLNINKIKDDSLGAPLGFSEMLKTGRPILVTGADRGIQSQLLAKIQVDCVKLPAAIMHNSSVKSALTARVQRKKGFQGSIRQLMDLEFLSPEVKEKIGQINSGGDPTKLSEAEVVNLTLLADMVSRYRNILDTFKEALDTGNMNIQQLMSLFELMISDLPVSSAVKAFDEFLGDADERPESVKSKGDLFGFINKYINSQEASSQKESRSQKLDSVFKRITSVLIENRLKVDPLLWGKCSFVFDADEAEKNLLNTMIPVSAFIGKTIDQGDEGITSDFKNKLGQVIYELVVTANMKLEEAKGDALSRMQAAQYFLPMFQMQKFNASHLVQISESNRETLLNKERFINLFDNLPISQDDLKTIFRNLDRELNQFQIIMDQVRTSTLDVLDGHDKDREKILRDIYIVNAAQELVHFSFHLGEAGLGSLERLCGVSVTNSRFGFDTALNPTVPNSIGVFLENDEAPLGRLQNEASLLSRAYTALVGIRVENLVKKLVNRKIGYLQATFGDNFFEVIYQKVVTQHDLPLSRSQLAWFIQSRGLMGSLGEKGFKSERENDLQDSFLTLQEATLSSKAPQRDFREFDNFGKNFQQFSQQFKVLMSDLRAAGEGDPTSDIKALLWSLYRKGIFNLDRPESREVFRKSRFYIILKELIAKVSSENYSVFTSEIQQEGVKIYLMPKLHFLVTIGARFSFLIESKVVRYQLVASPAETMDELDSISRVFNEKMGQALAGGTAEELVVVAKETQRTREIWRQYSRHLAFAMLDRFLSDTVIKQLKPGKIQVDNLLYLPDSNKLCLGPSLQGQKSVPFTKILQVPENMGNIQKNQKSCSTTVDDFTIEVHKINRLREELDHLGSVGEDVLDIIQNLTHERAESQLVLKYEQALGQMTRILSKPLRHISEKDVQLLHKLATAMKATLQAFYNTPGSQKDQLVMRVQSQLQARRSDGHSLKLNFTDGFIIDTTEIKVTQRQRAGEETVTKQRKVEVEVDASYQTLPLRVREVIRTHQILDRKQHIVFSPEGQKKKQVDYVLDIIETLQSLRGSGLVFYVDTVTLSDDQMQRLATRIKPHNFFHMDQMKTDAPEGMKVTMEKDPLSGRMVKKAVPDSPPATAAN